VTLAATTPFTMGFVLLSSTKATLPVSPAAPTIEFVWDGSYPSIKDKSQFKDGIYEDLDDHDFMAVLLTEAMKIWNDVPAAFVELTLVEDSSTAKQDDQDKLFSIIVEESSNASSAAFAQPRPNEDDLTVIGDCDIVIADRATDARDLAYTIAHELGHCLGLGHQHTNYKAMMGYSRDTKGLSLGADDIHGLIYLYPHPDYTDGKPKELVCGVAGGATAGMSLALMALPLAFAALRRRRAR